VNEKPKTMNIAIIAEELAKKLKSCEYAGEVTLLEADLPLIAKEVRRELFTPDMHSIYRKCLLALAINCMYYEQDEKGFWVHFCGLTTRS